MPYFISQGIRIYFKDIGKGEAFLLVPGLGADSRAFNPLLSKLGRGVRILAPDPRCLGRSQGDPRMVTMGAMVSDLIALLDHCGIRRVIPVGASFGCLVIRELFIACPNLAEKMIFISPPWPEGKETRKALEELKSILNADEQGEMVSMRFLERILSPKYLCSYMEEIRLLAKSDPIDETRRKVMQMQLSILEADRGEWSRVRVPVLLVAGSLDSITPTNEIQAFSELLPCCRTVVLEGVGHHIVMEAAEELAKRILEFSLETGP